MYDDSNVKPAITSELSDIWPTLVQHGIVCTALYIFLAIDGWLWNDAFIKMSAEPWGLHLNYSALEQHPLDVLILTNWAAEFPIFKLTDAAFGS